MSAILLVCAVRSVPTPKVARDLRVSTVAVLKDIHWMWTKVFAKLITDLQPSLSSPTEELC